MHTLVIYDQHPEEKTFYLIPDEAIDEEARAILAGSHLKYVNGGDLSREETDKLLLLGDAFASKPEYCSENAGKWACRWLKYKHEDKAPITVPLSMVVLTGFYL